jgi:hypothetical protein
MIMMCQHFYGHKIKLLLATFRNQQVTCNHSLNDVVYEDEQHRYPPFPSKQKNTTQKTNKMSKIDIPKTSTSQKTKKMSNIDPP